MAPQRMVKFVASDDSGLPLKRSQVPQACQSCRKKKKRCLHIDSATRSGSPLAAPKPTEKPKTPRQRLRSRQAATRAAVLPHSPLSVTGSQDQDEGASQIAANQLVELSSRFVGDMNPEGIFIQAATPTSAAPESSYRDTSDLGIWLRPASKLTRPLHDTGRVAVRPAAEMHDEPTQSSPTSELARLYQQSKSNYLRNECLALLPPDEDFRVLKMIFREKVHPIFPIFNDVDLDGGQPSSVYATLVSQVVALAAAADTTAWPHLRLEPGGPLLGFQEFHGRLSTAVLELLAADMVTDQIDLIRILSSLALFYQPSSPRDRNRGAQLFSEAVHHVQTLGVHLRGYRPQREDENIERLYCAVWASDKLTAAFYARPCLLHERDIDRSLDECIDKQPPCFRLFLRVVQCLDKTITLYRPNQPFFLIDLPVYETLIVDAGAEKLPIPLLGTLEILYHAASVLSCRQPSSAFSDHPREGDFSYIPHPSINPRRSLSADRIFWVTQNQEYCPFPFVPYALSLALTVQYRKMRYSRTAMFRNRARVIFKDIVALLSEMGGVFSSARVNAGLGESILKQMEKTASSLARDEAENGPANRASTPARGDVIQGDPKSSNSYPNATAAGLTPSQPSSFQSGDTPFDPSILDNLDVDVDLFGYFDPSFNLPAIDTALEANLNMGIPQNWTVPWNYVGT